MSAMITRHLLIQGLVQGVGFRQYMVFKAQQLGISGWVRNRSDGSVEAVVQGTEDTVAAIIECAQRGPRASQVSGVTVCEVEGNENFGGRFDPRRDA
jgi:acylphosphatase